MNITEARHVAARIWQDQDMVQEEMDAEKAEFIAQILAGQTISVARETIQEAFNKDADFYRGYVDNVSMAIHDSGILMSNREPRNTLAKRILKLIFTG